VENELSQLAKLERCMKSVIIKVGERGTKQKGERVHCKKVRREQSYGTGGIQKTFPRLPLEGKAS